MVSVHSLYKAWHTLIVVRSAWLVVRRLQKVGMLAMQAGRRVAELWQPKLLARRQQQCKAPPPHR